MSSNIGILYSHFRAATIDTKLWVNSDLQLVAKPSLFYRIFGDRSHTDLSTITQKLSTTPSGMTFFVKRVLGVLQGRHDPGLKMLRVINQCNDLVMHLEPDSALEKQFRTCEDAYFDGKAKPIMLYSIYKKLQEAPKITWSSLPPEIMCKIFEQLSFKELAQVSCACKQWECVAKKEWERRQVASENIPYFSSIQATTLSQLFENRAWMARFTTQELQNNPLLQFSDSVTRQKEYVTKEGVPVIQVDGRFVAVSDDGTCQSIAPEMVTVLSDTAMCASGILYVQINEHTLSLSDLLTKYALTEIRFKNPAKVIPCGRSILYTDSNELRRLSLC